MGKYNKIAAALSVLALTLGACSSNDPSSKMYSSSDSSSESETVTASEKTTASDEQSLPEDLAEKKAIINVCGVQQHCESKAASEFHDLIRGLKELDMDDITFIADNDEWELYLYDDNGYNEYRRRLTTDGWVLFCDDLSVYEDSPELNELIGKAVKEKFDISGGTDEQAYWSVDCDEPETEEEYLDAAVSCTDSWLKSLQSEDTDDHYRNESYEITVVEEESGHQKCNYLACGLVNEAKEFAVEICFTANDCGEGTFYDDYYQEGRYTYAGTYWSGQYICGRFRWENGKVSLINMSGRDGCDKILSGLDGITDTEYKNFYEFARRDDYQEVLDASFMSYGRFTASRNLTQTMDGKPINIDIYGFELTDETDDSYTGIWDMGAYINKKSTYSTGLYFTDNGTGHMPDTLPKDFSLTFDNYDGDANPDFCCRYDSDENGTYYVLHSIQTDGRIFNLSGRAFQGGIYIAGCTDPSPRLQRTDDMNYIGWKLDESGRYYPTGPDGEETVLPELNMYSDRYHLPNALKKYSEDEKSVTCFLWNNTENAVKTDSTYSIEVSEKGKWRTVAEGLSIDPVTVLPREYAEVTFDISSVKDRKEATYRIVLNSGDLTAYGKFILEGSPCDDLEIIAEDLYVGACCGRMVIKDHGVEPTLLRSAYITDGTKKYPLYFDANESTEFFASELPDTAGSYKLVMNDTTECTVNIRELTDLSVPNIDTSADISDKEIKLTVTADEDCECFVSCVWKKGYKNWYQTILGMDNYDTTDLTKGVSTEMILNNEYISLLTDEDYEDMYEHVQEMFEEGETLPDYFDEIGIDKNTSKKEFIDKFKKYFACDPDGEYAYVLNVSYNDVIYEVVKK